MCAQPDYTHTFSAVLGAKLIKVTFCSDFITMLYFSLFILSRLFGIHDFVCKSVNSQRYQM